MNTLQETCFYVPGILVPLVIILVLVAALVLYRKQIDGRPGLPGFSSIDRGPGGLLPRVLRGHGRRPGREGHGRGHPPVVGGPGRGRGPGRRGPCVRHACSCRRPGRRRPRGAAREQRARDRGSSPTRSGETRGGARSRRGRRRWWRACRTWSSCRRARRKPYATGHRRPSHHGTP